LASRSSASSPVAPSSTAGTSACSSPAGHEYYQQQAKFDRFVTEFNTERLHETLAMKVPADVYSKSTKLYSDLPGIEYTMHDGDILVTACERICMHCKKSQHL
jgi:hypothetical protein